MKTGLQIFSWIGIVLGLFAVVGATTDPEPTYALVGGGLFFFQGFFGLAYIAEVEKK